MTHHLHAAYIVREGRTHDVARQIEHDVPHLCHVESITLACVRETLTYMGASSDDIEQARIVVRDNAVGVSCAFGASVWWTR